MKTAEVPAPAPPTEAQVAQDLIDRLGVTLGRTSARSRLLIAALGAMVLIAIAAWVQQARNGLAVTGLNDRVVWGLYIATFVFFIGISMAGTLISAILRIAGAEWRRPITRVAEGITVASLLVAVTMIAADMGRPDRLLSVLWNANLRSPVVWDVLSISTYLVASFLYLGLPLIPDIALLRDHPRFSPVRRACYRVLSLGWTGEPSQRRRLARAMAVTGLTVIPAAIAVHSVTAWLFGMTLREGWNSPLMAPYFVSSALFSGTAVIILALRIVRRVYRLDDHITDRHITRLGRLLLIFGIGYAYLTFAEYLTGGFKLREGEDELLHALVQGPFAPLFWVSMFAGTIIPIAMLAGRRGRRARTVLFASALVTGGMMLKRFLIVVPSLGLPLMPTEWAHYRPSATEIIITAGAFAAFGLFLVVFARAVPIVSVTEIAEGVHGRGPDAPDDRGGATVVTIDAGSGGRKRARVTAAATVALAFTAMVVANAARASDPDPPPETAAGDGRVKVDVALKDATGRPLPGAAVELTATLPFLGEEREAVLDRARTDQAGKATLWFRPAQAGRFEGRVRFAGAAMWSATEAPVVFDVARPLWRWAPQSHGPNLPWLRAWLILVPAAAVWGLLAYAAWQALRIRPSRRMEAA